MTTDYKNLRTRLASYTALGANTMPVVCIELAELLAAYDALLAAGSKPKKANGYTPEFEQMWTEYPKRGNHSKAGAFAQWKKRLKEGDSIETMIEGMRRFALVMVAECRANDKILHAETFFGPTKRYEDEWIVPRADARHAPGGRREVIKESDAERTARRELWGIPDLPPSSTESGGYDAPR